ncbi:hypothetical protein L1987_27971 [Smallanthus sonchifolius]|uniref:Uncharacterized protein n=1 Tax=Smallanthus sonchifolius TaxID=185202 RepID=A0ACB9ICM0_9ASTR|nr:hypothetical protein L1987_27971 [Smallanthus sonchifolius]
MPTEEPQSPISWSRLMRSPSPTYQSEDGLRLKDLDKPLSPRHESKKARKTELQSHATRKDRVVHISSDTEPEEEEGRGAGPVKEAQLPFKKRKHTPYTLSSEPKA